ncbi:copper homeostasis protein CutC [Acidipila sp. EB88]|uniref:copper homeostasis protein CutC n=1 Tax=Acidipila sp. EB88 TaxID=2305226 RepID=UPI000F5DA9CC|nr:copper homeostasis protein CutC [Acidipila sp. EB88]RRA47257.1 copper homeostasis protein CutC [Acidipila sp. EB88]
MNPVRLEIAVDHPSALQNAVNGGAERIELCSSLADGGLTPSPGFIEWALAEVAVPVHCIVRPRGGNFCYTPAELAVMAADIRCMRKMGAPGVVVGVLTARHAVDVQAMQVLREAAGPMRLCFHRAFDLAADRPSALEDVIRCGADILLTSGGAASLGDGAAEVRRIVAQAAGRIEIMGGAGVRVATAGELWRTIPIDTLHASLRSVWSEAAHPAHTSDPTTTETTATMGARDQDTLYTVNPDDVRAVLRDLPPRTALRGKSIA